MSLRAHINVDDLLTKARDHKSAHHLMGKDDPDSLSGSYAGRYVHPISSCSAARAHTCSQETEPIPKWRMPSKGMDPEAAYRIVHDETTTLDGQPNLNLASLCVQAHPMRSSICMRAR